MENSRTRYEYKYLITEGQAQIIKNRLLGTMSFDTNASNGQYNVRSLYFDTFNDQALYDNENGNNHRSKYRIRIYNYSDTVIKLEKKSKENALTYKRSCKISREQFGSLIKDCFYCVGGSDDKLLKMFQAHKLRYKLQPKVIVSYDREPFSYGGDQVRVTFDRGICTSDASNNLLSLDLNRRTILGEGQAVLEVKYTDYLPGFIRAALQVSDVQTIAFSKYYWCRKLSNEVTTHDI